MSAELLPDACTTRTKLDIPNPSIVETDPESDAELFEDAVEDLIDDISKKERQNVADLETVAQSIERDVAGLNILDDQDHHNHRSSYNETTGVGELGNQPDELVEEIFSETLGSIPDTKYSTENDANKTDECKSQESCLDDYEDSTDADAGLEEDEGKETKNKWDDGIDEEKLKEMEAQMTDEEKQEKKDESQRLKKEGNDLFKENLFEAAISTYTAALRICPLCFVKERSILYSNRAACKYRLEDHENSIDDCSKALELNSSYLKALLRRAECYEKTDKLDEALADYQKVVEMDPSQVGAREACMRLPDQIKERNEKMKEEMMGKLKDLGNLVLRPFGLSTDNFNLQQDPNSGSYSVNFVQNQQKK